MAKQINVFSNVDDETKRRILSIEGCVGVSAMLSFITWATVLIGGGTLLKKIDRMIELLETMN